MKSTGFGIWERKKVPRLPPAYDQILQNGARSENCNEHTYIWTFFSNKRKNTKPWKLQEKIAQFFLQIYRNFVIKDAVNEHEYSRMKPWREISDLRFIMI